MEQNRTAPSVKPDPDIFMPYRDDGEIDFSCLESLIDYLAKIGRDGLFAECGQDPDRFADLLQKRGIFANALTEGQKKELDAFDTAARLAFFRTFPKEKCVLLFEPDTAFPECHASSILPLPNGDVLAVYFAGAHEKADDVGIWLSERRKDRWLTPRRIAKVSEEAHWNPVLFPCRQGIGLVFKVGREIPDWKSYSMFSSDGGQTWSAPVPFDKSNEAGGPVRNKPLLLADGRLLAPASFETADVWQPFVDVSEDDGRTFRRLSEIPIERNEKAPCFLNGKGAIQPTLWESEPGKVHALLRTTAGRIFRSDSTDGGRTWCTAYPTQLPNNNSGIDLARWKDALYLVMNPIPGDWAIRTPLILMRSTDNGQTFRTVSVLADELMNEVYPSVAEFSYPAIVAREGSVHITFTYNRRSIAYCCVKAE